MYCGLFRRKMKCALLVLAHFIGIALHSTTPFSFREAFLLEGRRVKREQCQHGVYNHGGDECCKCPPGHYVTVNCGKDNKTKCERCQENTYYEEPNSRMECERCRSCNANVHQETEEMCTAFRNTKCKCMEGYWGVCQDTCQCHPCDKCEGQDIHVPCTDTKNAQCGELSGGNHHQWIIPVVLLLILLIVLVLLIVRHFWMKRRVCFSGVKEKCPDETEFELDPLVPGVDLSNHLYDIVEELGPQLVKELAVGSGIRDTHIQMRINEHPHNTKEQCYNILKDWYEKNGLSQAFPELIKFLRRNGKNTNADKLNNLIIQKTKQTSCVNMDNPEQPA